MYSSLSANGEWQNPSCLYIIYIAHKFFKVVFSGMYIVYIVFLLLFFLLSFFSFSYLECFHDIERRQKKQQLTTSIILKDAATDVQNVRAGGGGE